MVDIFLIRQRGLNRRLEMGVNIIQKYAQYGNTMKQQQDDHCWILENKYRVGVLPIP